MKRSQQNIRLQPPFRHEGDYCWSTVVGKEDIGDSPDSPRRSPLVLFENETPLSGAHALHTEIHSLGCGRYSHWKNTLYFSTSDNSDPNANGFIYYYTVIPVKERFTKDNLAEIGVEEELFLEVVKANMNFNGSALYSLLCFRSLSHFARLYQRKWCNRTILEIGAAQRPGLALCLLMTGCKLIYSNNVSKLDTFLPEAYVAIITILMRFIFDSQIKSPEEFIVWEENENGRIAKLKPNYFVALENMRLEDVSLSADSFDAIISFSVLEHIPDPEKVAINMYRMLKPGGWCHHAIDLRDHNNFPHPLTFLKLSNNDYHQQGNTENRLRASDFENLFNKCGFTDIVMHIQDTPPKLTKTGGTDISDLYCRNMAEMYPKKRIAEVNTWVNEAFRNSLAPPFNNYNLQDLSILFMILTCEKAISN